MEYDIIIIGAGPGGYVSAIRAAQLGFKTALIEKDGNLGGTCMNVGCIPSKALLHSSELYQEMKEHGKDHGIHFQDITVDISAMQERKSGIIATLNKGIQGLMKHNGVDVYQGCGEVTDLNNVAITKDGTVQKNLKGRNILLATGSVPVEIPTLPFDGKHIVSSEGALNFSKPPKSLVIVGGGAIGLELGSVWSRLGSDVTVVEGLPEILPGWDVQLAKALKRELTKQGLKIITNAKITSHSISKGLVQLEASDSSISIPKANVVLVAVGRRPYWDPKLEQLGMEIENKRIKVDSDYRTSLYSILAIGDVIHGPMLAHKAEEEGILAVERLAGMKPTLNYEIIPNIVYTHPELASVGRSEEELKENGIEYVASTAKFTSNGRSLTMGNTTGFVKILAHKHTDKVLGTHIFGVQASSLISEVVSIMEFGGSSEDIARTVHSHPTLTETVKEAALGIAGHKIHSV